MKLQLLNWNRRNYDALAEFLSGAKPGEIAVFDWDNTCIFNDIGEALLRRLTFDLAFAFDAKALAAAIPDSVAGVGQILLNGKPFPLKQMKAAIIAAYMGLKSEARRGNRAHVDENYRIFTSGLLALNRALEETPGIGCEFAYPWVNTLLQGLSPAELDERAAAVIRSELEEPLRRHSLQDPLKRWRYDWTGGIRLYPEMKDLADRWQESGCRVAVSTASNRQLVEKMIAMTRFPCRQVIGMELALFDGRFGRTLKPGMQPNLGHGKVVNLRARFKREPALVAGDSGNDYEMLTAFPSARLHLLVRRPRPGRMSALYRQALSGDPRFLLQDVDRKLGSFASGPGA